MKKKLYCSIVCLLFVSSAISVAGMMEVSAFSTKKSIDDHENNVHPASTSDWWSKFHHDLANTGFSSSSGPSTNTTLWYNSTGSNVRSSPAVIDERVYVGSYDGKIYCFDAATGDNLWNTSLGISPLYSSPAVADSRVYIGSFDGKVYCLNTTKGDIVWRFDTGGYVISSPTVTNDAVYIGSCNDSVYCLNATGNGDGTTTVEWQYPTKDDVRTTPAVVNGYVYVGTYDGNVTCIDAKTGIKKWNFPIKDEYIFSSPAVADGKVYVGANTTLYCLDAVTGIELWGNLTDQLIFTSPAVAYGRVYIGSHLGGAGNVSCFDAVTGDQLWVFPTGSWVQASPAVADGKVYIGSCDSTMYCLDAITGIQIWSYTTAGAVWSSTAISEGKIYVGSDDGKLYCFGELNSPPDIPTITGPTAAGPGIMLNFTMSTTEPDGDQIYYFIDWGDGNQSDWLGPYNSSELVIANHSWTSNGNYAITVKANDTNGAESAWSDPLDIFIAPQLEITNIKPGFIYFRFIDYNKSYIYLYLLEKLGISIVITDGFLEINTTVSDAVHAVKFTAVDILFQNTTEEFYDDNMSDGALWICTNLSSWIYNITVSTYDAQGNMIDTSSVPIVGYLQIQEKSSTLGHHAKPLSIIKVLLRAVHNRLHTR